MDVPGLCLQQYVPGPGDPVVTNSNPYPHGAYVPEGRQAVNSPAPQCWQGKPTERECRAQRRSWWGGSAVHAGCPGHLQEEGCGHEGAASAESLWSEHTGLGPRGGQLTGHAQEIAGAGLAEPLALVPTRAVL